MKLTADALNWWSSLEFFPPNGTRGILIPNRVLAKLANELIEARKRIAELEAKIAEMEMEIEIAEARADGFEDALHHGR